MNKKVIDITDLNFVYETQPVLESIDLTVYQGEFLALMGPNGSGKSTLTKLILGLLKPQSGTIQIFGESPKIAQKKAQIGYVSQKANSFNRGFPATVREVVASGRYGMKGLFRMMQARDWQKVEEVITKVGLASLQDQNIGKLSGGQQQRAFIARALVSDPQLLVLDEPTVGVDASSSHQFYALLQELHQKLGLTIILVTHDIGAITHYVDRVVCLNKKLHFHGTPAEFDHNKETIFTNTYGHEVQMVLHQHE
ncbi:metal ABC transporter ATP-binding protein [Hazenella sp. IB182353]|uniref:metal ABC transporter ATP-binding protein n=1 Tax=Polycladospora coralii TaxID=2771432 RepID=UPI001746B230|nr:metal ABC transporter ATP-binding protein [Polycladospora coralii]MBS7530544.1 metal ABC transporter ATP-binding protein [Polycladospora coralii]